MINLEDEIKELKQSFDDCDFGGGETKRMFEIIEQLQKENRNLNNIYLFSRTDYVSYEEFDGFVVISKNREQALELMKVILIEDPNRRGEWDEGTLIGTSHLEPRVVLSSWTGS